MQVKLLQPTMRNTRCVGVQCTKHDGTWLGLYFSYNTIVAFREYGHMMVASHNIWSNTTGRHLNEIDGGRKEDRLDPSTFQLCLNKALEDFFNT